jgi:hypothetical protein
MCITFWRACLIQTAVSMGKYWPLRRLTAVEIILPVTDSEFLIEAGVICADVRDASPVLVTHVEDLTMVLRVGVETDGSVRTVERERQVRKFLPSLGLEIRTRSK